MKKLNAGTAKHCLDVAIDFGKLATELHRSGRPELGQLARTISTDLGFLSRSIAGLSSLTAAADNADFEAWERGDVISYAGITIVPKRDLPPNVSHGWIVEKGACNALPGATWGTSLSEAKMLANVFLLTGDTPEFWYMVRALQWARGENG